VPAESDGASGTRHAGRGRVAGRSDLPLTRDRVYCSGGAGRAGAAGSGMAGISGAGTIKRITIGVRSSFWFVPTVLVLVSMALALGLVEIGEAADREMTQRWPRMFAAEAEGSRAMLSAIATSMITVAGVVFSITIVALAQASTLYTSRVLRNFMRDRINQVVLGVFLGVFAYCIVVLRTVSGGSDGNGGSFVPAIAVFVGLVLALVGIGVLVLFIHHIATTIQASEIVRSITRETQRAIDRLFPQDLGHEAAQAPVPAAQPGPDVHWHRVPAAHTGYIQSVQPDALLGFAVRHDVLVRMDASVGEFIVEGGALAHVARATPPDDEFVRAFNALYAVDAFRTTDQDAVFGFRQLVDIALKALSPSVNDTTTAVICLDHLCMLLQRAARRRAESPYRSEDSHLRVIARGPEFADLAELAFGQILENAQGNTVVLLRLLRGVRDTAAMTPSAERRGVLAERVDVIEEVGLRTAKSAHARAEIEAAVHEARDACCGRADPGADTGAGRVERADGNSARA
jgi:uncharacterized membrane protein